MINSVEHIWEEFHDKLYAFINKQVKDSVIADDILQEVFLRIHSHISTFKSGSNLQAWVFTITRNCITDHYRDQKPQVELPMLLTKPEKAVSEKARTETRNWLVPMIKNLPEPYRGALMLAEIEQLPQKEVAKMQGVSLSCVKSRIQRGRIKLKQMLFTCCNIELDHQGDMLDCEPKPETLKQINQN